MNFVGTGKRLEQGDIGFAARQLGTDTAAMLAILEIEAAGRGFDTQNRPKMLFEPHVFYRNLTGAVRDRAVSAGLAYRSWIAGKYPRDSYPRLTQAIGISREAAFRSASYGLPQILGENHSLAGFSSAEQMVRAMMQGEREQLLAMVEFIKRSNLARHLNGKDFTLASSWREFARGYNGPGFETHGYHTRLANAYRKHKNKGGEMIAPIDPKPRIMQHGMKGEDVRNVQVDLQTLGYVFDLGIDGRFGNETRTNVRQFQMDNSLLVDGRVGSNTLAAIARQLAFKEGVGSEPPPPAWDGQQPVGLLSKLIAAIVAAFRK